MGGLDCSVTVNGVCVCVAGGNVDVETSYMGNTFKNLECDSHKKE